MEDMLTGESPGGMPEIIQTDRTGIVQSFQTLLRDDREPMEEMIRLSPGEEVLGVLEEDESMGVEHDDQVQIHEARQETIHVPSVEHVSDVHSTLRESVTPLEGGFDLCPGADLCCVGMDTPDVELELGEDFHRRQDEIQILEEQNREELQTAEGMEEMIRCDSEQETTHTTQGDGPLHRVLLGTCRDLGQHFVLRVAILREIQNTVMTPDHSEITDPDEHLGRDESDRTDQDHQTVHPV